MWHVRVEVKCIQGFHGAVWKEDHFEDLGVDGRIILKEVVKR